MAKFSCRHPVRDSVLVPSLRRVRFLEPGAAVRPGARARSPSALRPIVSLGQCRYSGATRGDCGLAAFTRRGLRCTEESSFGRMGQLDKIGGNLAIFDRNSLLRDLLAAGATQSNGYSRLPLK